MKLTKDITGCSGGGIYPRVYAKGEECPEDLIAAAIELGALDKKDAKKASDEAAEAARLEKEKAERVAAEEEAARIAAEEEAAKTAAESGQG